MKEKPVTLRLAFAKRPHLEGHVRVTVVAECVAEKACVLGGTSWAHVGPFRALATLIGALAKLFCALAKQPSSGAEAKAPDTHFKGQCIVRSVVSI